MSSSFTTAFFIRLLSLWLLASAIMFIPTLPISFPHNGRFLVLDYARASSNVLTTWRLRRSHISGPHDWDADSCQERRAKELQRLVCPPVARGQDPTRRHGRGAVTLCVRHTPRYGCLSLLPPTNAALPTLRPPPYIIRSPTSTSFWPHLAVETP
jgi:hypothetical protein